MSWSLFTSGQTPKSWADALLKAGGWPVTAANEQSLIAWSIQEGGGGTYNPLNTTEQGFGATGTLNSAGVKDYPSWADGISATVATLQGGAYTTIVSDLKSGNGIGQNASDELADSWGTGTWEVSIGQHWSAAAAYLSGKSAALPGGSAPNSSPSSSPGGGTSILSIPSEITGFFDEIDKVVKFMAAPTTWVRLVAFLAGTALLLMAIYALINAAEGGIDLPSIVPVPV
jgi:hypothetical protein